ncbi:MAG: hypothetical protein ABI868_10140 [Acidobacteriota bacterium]
MNIGVSTLASNRAAISKPHLAMHVRSQAPIVIDEFRRASMDVVRILGAIGVQADLVLAVPYSRRPPRRPAGGAVIDLLIDTRTSVSGFSTNEVLLGTARPGQHESDTEIVLFLDQIRKAAGVYQKAVPTVLALVIAHEIGHVLLPAPAHSEGGIMQTPWDQRTMDQAADQRLFFTTHQGALIRQRLSGCCQVDSSRDRRAGDRGPN